MSRTIASFRLRAGSPSWKLRGPYRLAWSFRLFLGSAPPSNRGGFPTSVSSYQDEDVFDDCTRFSSRHDTTSLDHPPRTSFVNSAGMFASRRLARTFSSSANSSSCSWFRRFESPSPPMIPCSTVGATLAQPNEVCPLSKGCFPVSIRLRHSSISGLLLWSLSVGGRLSYRFILDCCQLTGEQIPSFGSAGLPLRQQCGSEDSRIPWRGRRSFRAGAANG